MDWPAYRLPVPPVLLPHSVDSIGRALTSATSLPSAASGVWITNNKAYFYPFTLTDWGTARQLLFFVGATSSGNIDMAIYDSQLNRIVSAGTTGMSVTTNTVQELNITDTVLGPGNYLLGVVCSTTVGTCFRVAPLADEIALSVLPVYEQASALPLPDPCVPVAVTETTVPIWVCGIQFASTF